MSGSEIDDAELARSWASVVKAVTAVQQSADQDIEALGIPFAYFSVLSLLLQATDHRLPMSRIARDLSMTSGGFTKLADRMARDGYIDRRGSAGDRRVVFAALTDAGRDLGRRAERSYRALLRQRLLGVVQPEQLREIAAVAERLHEANTAAELDTSAWQVSQRPDDAPDRRRAGDLTGPDARSRERVDGSPADRKGEPDPPDEPVDSTLR